MSEWLDCKIIGTLSNGINHTVVLSSYHEEYDKGSKVYQVFVGRREAEQIEQYQRAIYGEDVYEERITRPTTWDILCEIFTAFADNGSTVGTIHIVDACIDDMINDNVFIGKLHLELELENDIAGAVIDMRPSDIIAIVLNRRMHGQHDIEMKIRKSVVDGLQDIGDMDQQGKPLREVANAIINSLPKRRDTDESEDS